MEGTAGRYEFTPQQNVVLGKAARWVGLFAWIMIACSLIMLVGGILSADESSIGALIASAVYFAIGINFRGAAASMNSVIDTAGNDIEHLMEALDKLGSAFRVMGILFLIGVTLIVASIVIFGAMYATAVP